MNRLKYVFRIPLDNVISTAAFCIQLRTNLTPDCPCCQHARHNTKSSNAFHFPNNFRDEYLFQTVLGPYPEHTENQIDHISISIHNFLFTLQWLATGVLVISMHCIVLPVPLRHIEQSVRPYPRWKCRHLKTLFAEFSGRKFDGFSNIDKRLNSTSGQFLLNTPAPRLLLQEPVYVPMSIVKVGATGTAHNYCTESGLAVPKREDLIITAETTVHDFEYGEWPFFKKIARIFVCFTKLLSGKLCPYFKF